MGAADGVVSAPVWQSGKGRQVDRIVLGQQRGRQFGQFGAAKKTKKNVIELSTGAQT